MTGGVAFPRGIVSNTWLNIEVAVFGALALLVGVFVALGLMTRIRYRVGSRHVKVRLFGLCIRRVALKNIESVSKRPGDGWAERWYCTLRPKHRMLVIRKKRGLFKNFIITPKNRYVFRSNIERAMRRAGLATDASPDEGLEADNSAPPDLARPETAQAPVGDQDRADS